MKGFVFYGDRRDREITNYFLNHIGNQRTNGNFDEKKLLSQVMALSYVSVRGSEQDIEKTFNDIKKENLDSIIKNTKNEDKKYDDNYKPLKNHRCVGKFIDI